MVEGEPGATDDDGDEATPAKKRTRRGTRGGRNRRRKPVGAADEAANGAGPAQFGEFVIDRDISCLRQRCVWQSPWAGATGQRNLKFR